MKSSPITKLNPALIPASKVAGQVMFSHGERFQWKKNDCLGEIIVGELPQPQPIPPHLKDLRKINATGGEIRYYIGNGRWVSRCVCGNHQIKKGKVLRYRLNQNKTICLTCPDCRYQEKLIEMERKNNGSR